MPSNVSDHLPLLKDGRGLAHHKLGPGVVAIHSSAFQEMDDYAPYRIVFLLLFIVSSVVFWASYKLICEREETEDEGGVAAYQPLSHQPTTTADGDVWMADCGLEGQDEDDAEGGGILLFSHEEMGNFLSK